MTRKFVLFALCLFAAANVFAHAGEIHNYMGTVTAVQGGAFDMKTTAGHDVHVATAESTTITTVDGKPATASEITVGRRVVVKMSKDGKTALSVKLGQ